MGTRDFPGLPMEYFVFQDYPWNSWFSTNIHDILGFPRLSMKFLVFQDYPWNSRVSKTIHEILGCLRLFMKFLVFQEYPWKKILGLSGVPTYPWKSCFTGRAYGPASEPARDLISGSLGGEADSALAQSQVPFTPWTVSIKRQVRGFHSTESVYGIPYRLLIVRTGVVKERVDEFCARVVSSRSAAPTGCANAHAQSGSALTSAESAARWKGPWVESEKRKQILPYWATE